MVSHLFSNIFNSTFHYQNQVVCLPVKVGNMPKLQKVSDLNSNETPEEGLTGWIFRWLCQAVQVYTKSSGPRFVIRDTEVYVQLSVNLVGNILGYFTCKEVEQCCDPGEFVNIRSSLDIIYKRRFGRVDGCHLLPNGAT